MKLHLLFLILLFATTSLIAQPIIIDHTCTNIYKIPTSYINDAKTNLHIGYGFTSHGSQIVTGMSGLVNFMNSKGYPENLFKWNHSGSDGALHLYEGDGYGEGDLDHDAGYHPNWVNETREFLGTPNDQGHGIKHPETNVIMWAWCGQLSGYSSDDVNNLYINEMCQLESDYFGVTFVYMTGHSDGSGLEGTLHKNNQLIRNHCIQNDKVLFDYYDIECYDSDGNYYGDKHVRDDCSYDGGNWAKEWQNSHTLGTDWYQCESAHSEPLNANLKAFAAWWMWARLAGWDGESQGTSTGDDRFIYHPLTFELEQNYPNPFNGSTTIQFSILEKAKVKLTIYNIEGQVISNLIDEFLEAKNYCIPITFDKYPSGIYFYKLQVGHDYQIKRFLFLK